MALQHRHPRVPRCLAHPAAAANPVRPEPRRGGAGTEPWVEPWPGAVPPSSPDRGQDIRLAFVSLLHGLSPRARAVLLLHDGVGMTTTEAAAALGIGVAAARSALQRARTALPAQDVAAADNAPVEAYVDAWNAGDVGALIEPAAPGRGPHHAAVAPYVHRPRCSGKIHDWRLAALRQLPRAWPPSPTGSRRRRSMPAATTQLHLPHSLHVLAGGGQISEAVFYVPPLGASLIAAFELPPAY